MTRLSDPTVDRDAVFLATGILLPPRFHDVNLTKCKKCKEPATHRLQVRLKADPSRIVDWVFQPMCSRHGAWFQMMAADVLLRVQYPDDLQHPAVQTWLVAPCDHPATVPAKSLTPFRTRNGIEIPYDPAFLEYAPVDSQRCTSCFRVVSPAPPAEIRYLDNSGWSELGWYGEGPIPNRCGGMTKTPDGWEFLGCASEATHRLVYAGGHISDQVACADHLYYDNVDDWHPIAETGMIAAHRLYARAKRRAKAAA